MGKDRQEFPEPYTGLGVDAESKALMEFNASYSAPVRPRPKAAISRPRKMNADLRCFTVANRCGTNTRLEAAAQDHDPRGRGSRRGDGVGIVPFYLAIREAHLARREARKSDEVARFLSAMLDGVGPAVARAGHRHCCMRFWTRTPKRVGNELKNEPEVEADLPETLGHVSRFSVIMRRPSRLCRIAVDKAPERWARKTARSQAAQ